MDKVFGIAEKWESRHCRVVGIERFEGRYALDSATHPSTQAIANVGTGVNRTSNWNPIAFTSRIIATR